MEIAFTLLQIPAFSVHLTLVNVSVVLTLAFAVMFLLYRQVQLASFYTEVVSDSRVVLEPRIQPLSGDAPLNEEPVIPVHPVHPVANIVEVCLVCFCSLVLEIGS